MVWAFSSVSKSGGDSQQQMLELCQPNQQEALMPLSALPWTRHMVIQNIVPALMPFSVRAQTKPGISTGKLQTIVSCIVPVTVWTGGSQRN